MTEAQEDYLREKLDAGADLVSSGISLDMVRELYRDFRQARQQQMGSEFGAACLRLAHRYVCGQGAENQLLRPEGECRVLSVGVLGVALGAPKAIVDVRLEVTQPHDLRVREFPGA